MGPDFITLAEYDNTYLQFICLVNVRKFVQRLSKKHLKVSDL